MGLFDRLRRRIDTVTPHRLEVGPTLDDVDLVRDALRAEAQRLGRRERIALSIFMEHTDLDITRIDIYSVLPHLAAEGEIANVEVDSFGNQHFDLTDKAI
jgi:hypothetical protein